MDRFKEATQVQVKEQLAADPLKRSRSEKMLDYLDRSV
jgi:hypothetical protein